MIIVTTSSIEGRNIEEVMGLVRGTTVRSRHLFRDVGALLKLIVGGEVPEYTKLLAETREQAIDRMVDEAKAQGANAILSFRFATSEVAKGAVVRSIYEYS